MQIKEILVEESNVQPVNSPVTVGSPAVVIAWVKMKKRVPSG